MKPIRAALVAAVLLAAACKGAGETDDAAGPAASIDTTNAEALDGLSARQVAEEAKAMTPEQAAQAGIVDTTIHLENLQSSDSLPPGVTGPVVRPGAQAAATAAGRDTVAPLPETKGEPARP